MQAPTRQRRGLERPSLRACEHGGLDASECLKAGSYGNRGTYRGGEERAGECTPHRGIGLQISLLLLYAPSPLAVLIPLSLQYA